MIIIVTPNIAALNYHLPEKSKILLLTKADQQQMSVNPKQSPGFAEHVRLPMSVANYYYYYYYLHTK